VFFIKKYFVFGREKAASKKVRLKIFTDKEKKAVSKIIFFGKGPDKEQS